MGGGYLHGKESVCVSEERKRQRERQRDRETEQ